MREGVRLAFIMGAVLLWPLSSIAQTWDSIPNLPSHFEKRVAEFAKQRSTTGKILFLGNSITEGGDWKKLLHDSTVVNRGIGGDITFGIQKRIADIVRFKPSKLFLLIGINDLYKGIPEDVVAENIFQIVQQIKSGSPETRIFVQSIFPVNASFTNFPKGYDVQSKVVRVNEQLSKKEAPGSYTFIDLFSHFLDQNGVLDARLSTDGLHLSADGYQRWVKILNEGGYL